MTPPPPLTFNHHNGTSTPLESLSSAFNSVAYGLQDPFIYDATILENLFLYSRIGPNHLNLDQFWSSSLHDLGLYSLINHFGDTTLGERGSRLSGGQKKKLAFFRALASLPSIILLDEPTAGLDLSSEQTLLSILAAYCAEYNALALIISHSKSSHMLYSKIELTTSSLGVSIRTL